MPIPTVIGDLSTSAASNSPAGSDPPTEGDNYLRAISAILKQFHTDLGTAGTLAVGAGMVGFNTAATYATASVGYELAMLRNTAIPVERFGAVGDGTTDDSAAFQAAVNYAETLLGSSTINGVGCEIRLANKSYNLGSTPIVVTDSGLGFIGSTGRGTQLIGSANAMFEVGDATGAARTAHVGFKNINFYCSDPDASTTVAVELYRTTNAKFEDCQFVGWLIAIDSYRSSETFLDRCKFHSSTRTAQATAFIRLQGTDETAFASPATYTPGGGWHITDCEFAGEQGSFDTLAGILVKTVDGLYITQCHMTGCAVGLDIAPDGNAANKTIIDVHCTQLYIDEPSTLHATPYCVAIRGTVKETITLASGTGTSIYKNIWLTDCYLRGNSQADRCLLLGVTDGDSWWDNGTQRLENIKIRGGSMRQALIQGMTVQGANSSRVEAYDVSVIGTTFDSNASTSPSSTATAIQIEAESAMVDSCYFGADSGTSDYVVSLFTSDAGDDTPTPSAIVRGCDFTKATGGTVRNVNITRTVTGGTSVESGNLYGGPGRELSQSQRLTTTDATPADIWTYAIPTFTSGFIELSIVAADATGARYVVYTWTAAFKRDSGTAALDGGAVTAGRTYKDGTTPAPTFALSTNTLTATVTGVAATTINWTAAVRMWMSR